MADTLPCGHSAKYQNHYRVRTSTGIDVGFSCTICDHHQKPVREYIGDLCGIRCAESDPLDMLQAIVDDPDNYLPKSVFADWLDEQGDPRGELIRVEAELAKIEIKGVHPTITTENGPQSLGNGWTLTIGDPMPLRRRRTALRRQLGYDTPGNSYAAARLTD